VDRRFKMGPYVPQHEDISSGIHYVARGSADGVFPPVDRAAYIAAVNVDPDNPMTIDAVVLNPTGLFFQQRLEYSADRLPGTWHWAFDLHG
jgi:hypothetical protein